MLEQETRAEDVHLLAIGVVTVVEAFKYSLLFSPLPKLTDY